MRAGGSGSRGTRRLQPAPGPRPAAPEYECRKRHAAAGSGRAGPPARTVRCGWPSDVLLGPNERASTGRGPGLPRRWAAEFSRGPRPGRDDCGGGVSSGLRNPSSPGSNSNPGLRGHPLASPHSRAWTRPTRRGGNPEPNRRRPQGARPTMKWPSLYDLDFFWMTRANHCSLDGEAPARVGGGPSGLWGSGERKVGEACGIARRRAWSRGGLVWRPGTTGRTT